MSVSVSHPDVQTDDVDAFESQLDEFLSHASLDELREAVYQASVFVENKTKNDNAVTEINNATSTFGRVTGELIKRVRQAEIKGGV